MLVIMLLILLTLTGLELMKKAFKLEDIRFTPAAVKDSIVEGVKIFRVVLAFIIMPKAQADLLMALEDANLALQKRTHEAEEKMLEWHEEVTLERRAINKYPAVQDAYTSYLVVRNLHQGAE